MQLLSRYTIPEESASSVKAFLTGLSDAGGINQYLDFYEKGEHVVYFLVDDSMKDRIDKRMHSEYHAMPRKE